MKISIVIRCFNEEEHIGRLLSGVMRQTRPDFDLEIIVVDSGSTDATLAIASRYPVEIIHMDSSEFTFGRSLNLGCNHATGDFIVIVSAHVYPVYKDWLTQLLEPFKDPEVALVYGKQRGNEVTKYSEKRIFAQWFPDQVMHTHDEHHPFCNNANSVVRKSVWKKVPYDESLAGLEDIDWAKRAIKLGHKIEYVPGAEIIHVHNEKPANLLNRYRREAVSLKQSFPEQQFSIWDLLRLFVTNTSNDYYHAVCDKELTWKNLWEIPEFRLMQFLGAYIGFRQIGVLSGELKQRLYYPTGFSRAGQSQEQDSRRKIDYSDEVENGK